MAAFSIEAGTVFDIAGALFERRNRVKQAALRALNYMRRGHIKVMAFGTGGTGKTTLGELFQAGFTATSKPKVYDRSVTIEQFAMPGELVCTLYAAPGQERYREEEALVEGSSWSNLYREITKGKSVGIINVVSYGYHSIRTLEIEETDLFKPGMTAEMFLPLYLESRREKEVEVLRKLVPHIGAAPGKVWMMTLVTKQDLWWNERSAVERFYREGTYQKEIDEIARQHGKNFQHEFVSASLVLDNFTTGSKKLLKPTTAGYDDNLRLLNLTNLARVTNSLIKG